MMTGDRFIDVNGTRTRYFEKGSGEVLVLFHGSHFGTTDACDSAIDWELNFDNLAQWFRVIAEPSASGVSQPRVTRNTFLRKP